MTPLAADLAAVISPPRIGEDGFWVPDPTPEQAARMWMHEMNRRSLDRERHAALMAEEQAELQRRYWCDEAADLRSTLSTTPPRATQPPASANAELKAASITPHP
jgi:hypothetical protein